MSEGVTIGGCYPPSWPRPPKPPVDEPVPETLDERVEWLTWSHPELYDMVHEGIDLTGAMSVSASWARLGDELSDIGDELAKLLLTTAQSWEGDAAELAKESVSALAEWSRETGTRATEVCGCVAIQVDNVTNARNDMPPPPYPIVPLSQPHPSQVTAFTDADFATAKPLVVDPLVYTTRERELHEQAARIMERFQSNSRDVYATVPQFAPPSLRKVPYGPPTEPPLPPPPPQPPQPPPPPPVPGRPGGGGPAPGGGPGGSGGPGPTGGRAPSAAPLAPGGGTSAGEPAARPAAASAASVRPGVQGAPMAGGMPMGGGAGGRGGEDVERKGNKYVAEDPEIWGGNDERVMPPVIGEVNRRA
ncbi:PPE domain-containing protein [Actinophytocola glycyrrhizae]|uniref:PPE domain-containing protein n=1 Tax=Actinophytocola glycyrrhizae TaxID=2044873 RepID=A0ABV9S2I9_9PSEU